MPLPIKETRRYEDRIGININSLLSDLQAVPIGDPNIEKIEEDIGKERLVSLAGTYHAQNTTIRIEYIHGDYLDIEITGRARALERIKNTLDRIFQ